MPALPADSKCLCQGQRRLSGDCDTPSTLSPFPTIFSPSCLKSWVRAGCPRCRLVSGVSCPPRHWDGLGLLSFSGEAEGSPKSRRRPWFSLLRLTGEQGWAWGMLQRLSSPGEEGKGSAAWPSAWEQPPVVTASLSAGEGMSATRCGCPQGRCHTSAPQLQLFLPKLGGSHKRSCARDRVELGGFPGPSTSRVKSAPHSSP